MKICATTKLTTTSHAVEIGEEHSRPHDGRVGENQERLEDHLPQGHLGVNAREGSQAVQKGLAGRMIGGRDGADRISILDSFTLRLTGLGSFLARFLDARISERIDLWRQGRVLRCFPNHVPLRVGYRDPRLLGGAQKRSPRQKEALEPIQDQERWPASKSSISNRVDRLISPERRAGRFAIPEIAIVNAATLVPRSWT